MRCFFEKIRLVQGACLKARGTGCGQARVPGTSTVKRITVQQNISSHRTESKVPGTYLCRARTYAEHETLPRTFAIYVLLYVPGTFVSSFTGIPIHPYILDRPGSARHVCVACTNFNTRWLQKGGSSGQAFALMTTFRLKNSFFRMPGSGKSGDVWPYRWG